MPMPLMEWAVSKDGLWLAMPADGEKLSDMPFAPWGQFEPYRQESEADARAALSSLKRYRDDLEGAEPTKIEVTMTDDAAL